MKDDSLIADTKALLASEGLRDRYTPPLLRRWLEEAEHELPLWLITRVESALDTAVGVTSVHAPEVHREIMDTAVKFSQWLEERT